MQGYQVNHVGLYINLDRSVERRAAMEAQIARHGLHGIYRRFSGADGNILGVPTSLTAGEIGCLTSHYLVCREHVDSAVHLHVVEDDTIFSGIMSQTIHAVISSGFMEQYDILFLDSVINPFSNQRSDALWKCKKCFDAGVIRDEHGNVVKLRDVLWLRYSGGSGSYIINCRSIRRLLSVYEQVLAAGAEDQVDLMIRDRAQAGQLRVGVLFPFVTSARLDDPDTTIAGRERDQRSALAIDLLRRSFFVDRDIDRLFELGRKVFSFPAGDVGDRHDLLLKRLSEFFWSDQFRDF